MSGTLTGRSAIVTGAARGIGLAVARLLVRAEARVLLADPDERRLEVEVAALNAAQHRGEATAFCCNLGDRLDMANLLTAAWEAQGGLDILVDANLLAEPSDLLAPASTSWRRRSPATSRRGCGSPSSPHGGCRRRRLRRTSRGATGRSSS